MLNLRSTAFIVLGAIWGPGVVIAEDKPELPPPVIVPPVVEREVTVRQSFVGTVVPLRTSVVGSAVDGRVLKFLVNEGDTVQAQQPLAVLRTETLEIELAAAEAELILRREELAELKNGSLPEEIAQSEARMRAAAASSDYLKSNYERMLALFKQNRTITDEQLREARSTSEQAEQMQLEAKAVHSLAQKGPRKEKIAQAQAQVLMQTEQVNLIKERIKRHTIVAPFDGYVTAEHTEMGEWISEGDPVAEIVQLSDVDIRAGVLSKHAANLELGAEVPVTISALPGQIFSGKLVLVVPQAEELSRSIPVKIRVKNQIGKGGPLLKSGMIASIRLPTDRTLRAPLIPKDALVLEDGEKPVVFIVDRESSDSMTGVVKSVPVDLGLSDGEWIGVSGELTENQFVVVRGNERLRSGQKVTISKIISPDDAATE